MGRQPRF